MLTVRTFIVRIYRRTGARAGEPAGVVEIVGEQRSVWFAGLSALGAILAGTPRRGRSGARRKPVTGRKSN